MASTQLNKLRNYRPRNYQNAPKTVWHQLPVNRRSAVLILLFLGAQGELRVLLTKRSSRLKSFPGQISLPGGKADTGLETAWDVALREAEEEIGIPRNPRTLLERYGCLVEQLAELPCYMSRNLLAVRPCVGYLSWAKDTESEREAVAELIALALNPGETSAIFSIPLEDLYLSNGVASGAGQECIGSSRMVYKWAGIPWSLKSFLFPLIGTNDPAWITTINDLVSDEDSGDEEPAVSYGRTGFRRSSVSGQMVKDVWGLTANILHDLSEVVYGQPQKDFGEEELIYALRSSGQSMLSEGGRTPWEKRIIEGAGEGDTTASFADVLDPAEFKRLKVMYKQIKL